MLQRLSEEFVRIQRMGVMNIVIRTIEKKTFTAEQFRGFVQVSLGNALAIRWPKL